MNESHRNVTEPVITQPAHDIKLEAIRERITNAIAHMGEAELRRVWGAVEECQRKAA